jgi:hypothetical protein
MKIQAVRTTVLSLALLLLTPFAVHAEIVAREGQGFLEKRPDGQLVLHLKGTPHEMGFQQGKLVGDLARATMERIVDNKGKLGESDQYTMYLLMREQMHELLRPHIPARFVEEMRGLAEGAGVPYSDVEAANLFPAAFHCSGIALKGKATVDGSLYHVRILDYMTKLGLQQSALIVVHEPVGLKKWLNVGFAGFIGSVTGMNESQIAIGEMGGKGLGAWDGMPMAFLIRDALERAETLDQAVEIFKTTPRTCEYYYVISDGKSQDAVGLWTTAKVFEVMHFGESYALFEGLRPRKGAAGGKAFLRGVSVKSGKWGTRIKAKGGSAFIATPPKDVIILSGPGRTISFLDRLEANMGKVEHTKLQELCKRPVSMGSNLHVAIFHPSTLEVWVAVAANDGSPACDQPYYRYQLAKGSDGSALKK